MATRTFIANGVSRLWSSATSWVEGSAPTAADDVVFSTNAAGSVLVIDGNAVSPSVCRSINTTGYTQTINQNTTNYLYIGDSGGGSLTLTAGVAFGGGPIYFVSTTTGNTITTTGHTLTNIIFDGAGGEWTLQDNLTTISNGDISLFTGTLNDGGYSVTTGVLSSFGTNTRSLIMSGSWTCGWSLQGSTGMTLTATGSTITTANSFSGAGFTYEDVILLGANSIVYGANTFTNLSYTGVANQLDSLSFADDQTITGTLTINGNSGVNRILIKSDTGGAARTLTAAALSITNADLQDITGAGATSWNLSAITGLSGDCGGCSGITFTTPMNCYMKTTGGGGGSWQGSNWYTTSGGSTPARTPLPQDTAIFDANSIASSSVSIILDVLRTGAMNWTGVTNTPDLHVTNTSLFGEMILSPFMTINPSFPFTITLASRGSVNVDNGGNMLGITLIQDGVTGTANQIANFAVSNLRVASGTWDTGSYTLSGNGSLYVDGGTLNLGNAATYSGGGLFVSGGTLEMNANTITVGGTAISGGTVNLSGQINCTGSAPALGVSGGIINDSGPAGEFLSSPNGHFIFTGGTATIRKLNCGGNITQSGTSSLTVTESGTYGIWTMNGSGLTFTTTGIPTWSGGTLTVAGSGGSGGGSWTFC